MNLYFFTQKGVNIKKEKIIIPTKLVFFDDKPSIQDVKTGWNYSMVLLADGSLYAMGNKYCCGQGTSKDHFYSPVLVSVGDAIQSICFSWSYTMVQNVNQQYYLFGDLHNCKLLSVYGKQFVLIPECFDHVISNTKSLTGIPSGFQVKKLIETIFEFFLLTNNNDLYVMSNCKETDKKNSSKWILYKSNVANVQTGRLNLFLFINEPFLLYESQMKFTDAIICF